MDGEKQPRTTRFGQDGQHPVGASFLVSPLSDHTRLQSYIPCPDHHLHVRCFSSVSIFPNCCFHVFQLVLYDFFAASGPIFLNQWLVASRSPDFREIRTCYSSRRAFPMNGRFKIILSYISRFSARSSPFPQIQQYWSSKLLSTILCTGPKLLSPQSC